MVSSHFFGDQLDGEKFPTPPRHSTHSHKLPGRWGTRQQWQFLCGWWGWGSLRNSRSALSLPQTQCAAPDADRHGGCGGHCSGGAVVVEALTGVAAAGVERFFLFPSVGGVLCRVGACNVCSSSLSDLVVCCFYMWVVCFPSVCAWFVQVTSFRAVQAGQTQLPLVNITCVARRARVCACWVPGDGYPKSTSWQPLKHHHPILSDFFTHARHSARHQKLLLPTKQLLCGWQLSKYSFSCNNC